MIKAELYCELVKDALNEYSYDADLAGLLFSLYPMSSSIELGIGGYNDKLPVLAKVVLERIRDLEIDPGRFAVIKEVTARNYRNFKMSSPSSLAGYWTTHLTSDIHWNAEEKEAELLSPSLSPAVPKSWLTQKRQSSRSVICKISPRRC